MCWGKVRNTWISYQGVVFQGVTTRPPVVRYTHGRPAQEEFADPMRNCVRICAHLSLPPSDGTGYGKGCIS